VNSTEIGGIVFACAFGGALVGIALRALLPDRHLTDETKDVVKMGTGLIGTLTALVLGLLIASAKSSFDAQRSGLELLSAKCVVLDRGLARFGPETKAARQTLRHLVESMIEHVSSATKSADSGLGSASLTAQGGELFDRIRQLTPKTDSERWLQTQAMQVAGELANTRSLLTEQQESTIPTPFLVVVIFWVTALFASFGLFSSPNPVVIATLLLCALSVGGAIFLIVDLDQPFGDLIRISNAPLRNALSQLGQ